VCCCDWCYCFVGDCVIGGFFGDLVFGGEAEGIECGVGIGEC